MQFYEAASWYQSISYPRDRKNPSAVTALHGYCFLPFPIFVGQYIFVSQKPPDCARSSPDHLQTVHSPLRPAQSQLNTSPGATGSHLSLLLPTEPLKGSLVTTHSTEKRAEDLELQLEKVNSPETKSGLYTIQSEFIIKVIVNVTWHWEGTSAVSRWLREEDKWAQ